MPLPVLCIGCGYDLRTLDPRSDCPECGTLIEKSIHGDWLRYANEHYLNRITRGLRWLTRCRAAFFWIFLSMVCMLFALMVISMVISLASLKVDISFERVLAILFAVGSLLLALLFVVMCITLLIMARPDPAREHRETPVTVLAPYVIAAATFALIAWIGFNAMTLDAVVREVAIMVCYLAAWVGMAVMPKIAMPIERRCQEASAARLQGLRRTPWSLVILAGLGLALYWYGPIRSASRWTMPTDANRSLLFSFTLLGWIIALGTFTTTRQAVEQEIKARSKEGEEEQLASSVS